MLAQARPPQNEVANISNTLPTMSSKFFQLADRFDKLGSSNEKLENHLLPECKTSQAGIQGLNIPL